MRLKGGGGGFPESGNVVHDRNIFDKYLSVPLAMVMAVVVVVVMVVRGEMHARRAIE